MVLHVFFDAASIQGRLLLNFKAFGCGFYSRAASIQGRLLLNFKAFGCGYTRGEFIGGTQQIADSVCKRVFRSMYYKRKKLVVLGTLNRRTDGTVVLHVFFDAASIQGRLLLNFKAFGCGLYSRAASI